MIKRPLIGGTYIEMGGLVRVFNKLLPSIYNKTQSTPFWNFYTPYFDLGVKQSFLLFKNDEKTEKRSLLAKINHSEAITTEIGAFSVPIVDFETFDSLEALTTPLQSSPLSSLKPVKI